MYNTIKQMDDKMKYIVTFTRNKDGKTCREETK